MFTRELIFLGDDGVHVKNMVFKGPGFADFFSTLVASMLRWRMLVLQVSLERHPFLELLRTVFARVARVISTVHFEDVVPQDILS